MRTAKNKIGKLKRKMAIYCGRPVILISGFSRPFSEFSIDCERVFNPDVCNGCYNDSQLDPSNWKWCPIHEDTDRMFECTKTITPSVVKESINNIIEKL